MVEARRLCKELKAYALRFAHNVPGPIIVPNLDAHLEALLPHLVGTGVVLAQLAGRALVDECAGLGGVEALGNLAVQLVRPLLTLLRSRERRPPLLVLRSEDWPIGNHLSQLLDAGGKCRVIGRQGELDQALLPLDLVTSADVESGLG